RIDDAHGLEGPPGSSAGLGLLDYANVLEPQKQLCNVRGRLALGDLPVGGYEIHAGVTRGPALAQPALRLEDGRDDGAISADGQVMATYLHGLFEEPPACAALLAWAGLREARQVDYHARRERDIERLADLVEAHLDTRLLRELCGL